MKCGYKNKINSVERAQQCRMCRTVILTVGSSEKQISSNWNFKNQLATWLDAYFLEKGVI